jgi:Cu+-exporting ATPase
MNNEQLGKSSRQFRGGIFNFQFSKEKLTSEFTREEPQAELLEKVDQQLTPELAGREQAAELKPLTPEFTRVEGQVELPESAQKLVALAAALENQSEHPLARAIVNCAEQVVLNPPPRWGVKAEVKNFQALPGHGIKGEIAGVEYFIGKPALDNEQLTMNNEQLKIKLTPEFIGALQKLEESGKTVVVVVNLKEQKILGALAIADTIKDHAAETINALQKRGLKIFLLTGDNRRTALAIASQVGIDPENVRAEILPSGKAREVEILQKSGLKIAFVGDGINDAPALATANLGIAMGSGTDVALEAGGIVLMKNDLRDIGHALELARTTFSKIKQNLFFAFFYNTIGIPIAARALIAFGFILKPELAGLAMAFSDVSVILNSLTLKFHRPGRRNYISFLAPIAMGLFFAFYFFEFARI